MCNRFFVKTDIKANKLGSFQLPEQWWSRPYEYAFASQFLEENDTILDAGCGIEHPFKFYAATKCKTVYCVDKNPDIEENVKILEEVRKWFGKTGQDAAREVMYKRNKMKFIKLDMRKLTGEFEEEKFDKIFCIGTLQHEWHYAEEILREFKKVLKPNGKIILTIDFPTMQFYRLEEIAKRVGLVIDGKEGKHNAKIPDNAIKADYYNLMCYHAVLEKKRK